MSTSQKNNFLYGGLNLKVANNTYIGGETSTATTYVDNVNNIITVDAKIDIESLESEIQVVRQEYNEIKQSYSEMKTSVEELKEADQELASKILTLESKVDKNVTKLNTKIDSVESSLTSTIASTKAELITDITTGDAALDTRITEVNDTLTASIASTKSQLEAEIQQVTVTVQELIQPKLEALETKISQVETTLGNRITSEVADLQSQINGLSDDIDDLREEINQTIATKISEIETKLNNLKTYVDTTIATQISAVLTLVNQLDSRVDATESTVTALGNRVTVAEQKVEDLSTKFEHKVEGMWHDTAAQLSEDKLWYLCYDINDPANTLVTDSAGKYVGYNLGEGGGGGGGTVTTDVKVNAVNWPTTIAENTECKITVNWSSTREGTTTGNGTLIVLVDDTIVTTLKNQQQGNVQIDITNYLQVGTNKIEVRALDIYSNVMNVIQSVAVVQISLTSDFDAGSVITSTSLSFSYTPYGATDEGGIKKTVYFILDGYEKGKDTDVYASGTSVTHIINDLTHGSHTLKVYFTCTIDGNLVTSNELYYDLMVALEGETAPVIASDFTDLEQEQYIAFSIPYRVYMPGGGSATVKLCIDNELINTLVLTDHSLQYWEYRPTTIGTFLYQIKCEDVEKNFLIVVSESSIDVQPVTQDLALYLNATGRSNQSETRDVWEYTDTRTGTPKTISAEFYNFNWVSDGWQPDSLNNTVLRVTGNARVVIPFKVFENSTTFTTYGRTIEIEFATSSVMDYETSIISCLSTESGRSVGFNITAQEAFFYSKQSSLSSKYKEDEHIRVAFTVQKDASSKQRLIQMYINGILCGIVQYPTTDSFEQSTPQDIYIGSSNATTDIYCIRVYDNDLLSKQIVNNWIADTLSGELKRERYIHNDNYSATGEISIAKLPSDLPYIIVTGERLSEGKKDKVTVDTKYVDPTDSTKNYTSEDSLLYVQGTSSAGYYRKNYRINYSSSGFVQSGVTYPTYAFRTNAIPADLFTYKADVASSEGANNVELVRLYEDASPVDTPAKKTDSRIRMGIDGIPAVMFFNNTTTGKTSLYSKVNFNNDKANESVYGFQDGDESWEFLNNNTNYCLFKEDTEHAWDELVWDEESKAYVENWARSFEGRYPDGNTDTTKLKAMVDWVTSTRRLATDTEEQKAAKLLKFKNELEDHFNLTNTLYYYIYTELFLLVDSRAKNAFPTYYASRSAGDGGDRWFWIPYDMDTAIGTNNEGALVFDYSRIDSDITETGDYVFNCQDSPMWANLRDAFQPEISSLYTQLRTAGKISYDYIESQFEAHQNKWSENIFNEDSQVKYIEPITVEGSTNYLKMAQGSKEQQRKWWLYNRFKYIDSKYNTASALTDKIQFRYYSRANMDITPYANVYACVSFASGNVVKARATKGEAVTLVNPVENPNNTECYVYSASQLTSIGDLAALQADSVDISAATRLQYLKLGDSDPTKANTHLGIASSQATSKAITIGNNKMLKYVDVRNCPNLTEAVDLSACTNLTEAYFEGTRSTGVSVPNGGSLEILHLPSTITTLEVRNQTSLEELTIENDSAPQLTRLWLENVPGDVYDFKEILQTMPAGSRIRVIGIQEAVTTVQQINDLYDLFDTMRGLDSTGAGVPTAQISGVITIPTITYAEVAAFKARYANIDIQATTMICIVKFFNEGEQYGETQTVYAGDPAVRPTPDPEKPWTTTEKYIFTGWDKDFSNVQSDMNINAVYETSTRYYTVTFDCLSSIPEPISPITNLNYGDHFTKPTNPYIGPSTEFMGWFLEPNCVTEFRFGTDGVSVLAVTEDLTLYAKWNDLTKPTVTIDPVDYNKFKFTLKDNVAITAYKITESSEAPTTWNYITPSAEVVNYYTVDHGGTYYAWAKDAASAEDPTHIVSGYIKAYNLYKDEALGTTIDYIYGSEFESIEDVAIENRLVTVHVTTDSHYHDTLLYYNGTAISSGYVATITSDTTCSATTTPYTYTCSFVTGQYGEQPPTQTITYHPTAGLVVQPPAQYDQGKVIRGWYESATFEGDPWDFSTRILDKDTILYANWQTYNDPTIISVSVSAGQQVVCNFRQNVKNGVEINWGDGSELEKFNVDDVSASHTYTSAFTGAIRLTGLQGNYYPGLETAQKAFVTPATVIRSVNFALNVPQTLANALANAVNMTDVTLNEYMTKIVDGQFRNCTSLTSIDLPDSISAIGTNAFEGCSGLTGTFTIPASCSTIGYAAFQYCTKITSFEISDTLTSLDQYAFAYCTSLLDFDLPNTIISIPSGTFLGCTALEEVNISSTVQTLGNSVFNGCTNLSKVRFHGTSLQCGDYCFAKCLKLITGGPDDSYNIVYNFVGKIPDGLFQVGTVADSGLTTFVLSNDITEIGSEAFAGSALTSITMTNNLTTIGSNAFSNCERLQVITIPNSVTSIGAYAFNKCYVLTTMSFPTSITSLGNNVLSSCIALRTAYMNFSSSDNKIQDVTNSWFYGCHGDVVVHVKVNTTSPASVYGPYWNYYSNGATAYLEVLNDIPE